jgi:hypothetical protein
MLVLYGVTRGDEQREAAKPGLLELDVGGLHERPRGLLLLVVAVCGAGKIQADRLAERASSSGGRYRCGSNLPVNTPRESKPGCFDSRGVGRKVYIMAVPAPRCSGGGRGRGGGAHRRRSVRAAALLGPRSAWPTSAARTPDRTSISLVSVAFVWNTGCAKDNLTSSNGAHLVEDVGERDRRRDGLDVLDVEQRLRFGRIVTSDIVAPNMLANLV